MNKQFHYFYKITNNINNKFYYGVHNTDNLDDGYMGSGKRLHYAYEKYGIENFTKEILKFFDTAEDAFKYESEIVTESLVLDDNCYNMQLGGKTFNITNLIAVKDSNNNYFLISKNDPRYISGELKFIWVGKHHTDKSREKIRNTRIKNGITGTRSWMYKDDKVKYLRNELVNEYEQNGWLHGRPGYKPVKGGQGKILK